MKKALSKFDIYAIAIGTAGVGYLTYRIIKKTKENSAKKKSLKEQEGEYKQFSIKEKVSYTATSYQNMAKRIFNAYEQNFGVYNTLFDAVNEKEIYAVFGLLKNNLDYLEMKKAFGVKPLPTAFLGKIIDPVDMETWLTNALSVSERAQLNRILKSKSIVIEI